MTVARTVTMRSCGPTSRPCSWRRWGRGARGGWSDGLPGATGRFAEGLAACLAGRLRWGGRLLAETATMPETGPGLAAGARLAASLCSVLLTSDPDEGAADATEIAEQHGIPLLADIG